MTLTVTQLDGVHSCIDLSTRNSSRNRLVHSSSRHVRRPVQEFIKLAARVAPALHSVRHGPDHDGREGANSSEFDALIVA